MKTLHLYLIAMTAALVACSSDEAIAPAAGGDVGGDDICFTTNISDVASRAICVDNATSLQSTGFWVKALKIDGTALWPNTDMGDMLHFAYNTTSGTFKPEIPEGSNFDAKWPTGQTLFLYASNIDPAEKKMTKKGAEGEDPYAGQMYEDMRQEITDVTQQKDFVYATNYGSRSDFSNGAVPLHFKHAFCQIEIQAKNENPAYTVKVKGYRIHFPYLKGNFEFPTPVKATTSAAAISNSPDATWNRSFLSDWRNYDSGYKNGFTVSDGIYDDDEANHYTLTATPQTISNGVDNGYAMVIPHGTYTATNAGGACLYLIVQIDYNNYADGDATTTATKSPLFPACKKTTDELENNLSTRVSYADGLPKYYGRIYVPYTLVGVDPTTKADIEWNTYAGKKVTILFDFSNGLGWVDRHKPVPVDPTAEGYNAAEGTVTTGSAAVLDNSVDPYSAYNVVLGSEIGVTATVSNWSDISETP